MTHIDDRLKSAAAGCDPLVESSLLLSATLADILPAGQALNVALDQLVSLVESAALTARAAGYQPRAAWPVEPAIVDDESLDEPDTEVFNEEESAAGDDPAPPGASLQPLAPAP